MTVTVVIKHFTRNKQAGYSNDSDSCHKTLYLEQTDWI